MSGEFVAQEGGRLDKVVAKKFADLSRSHIKTLIDEGNILLNGKVVKAGYLVKKGDKILFDFPQDKPLDAQPQDIDFKIIYQDEDIIVIDKPQGLVVHPCSSTKSGTLVNGLLYKIKNLSGINGVLRPGIVHRLDKNTSGLMIVAKNDNAHNFLAKEIADKENFKRIYIALCHGHFKDYEGRIEGYIARDKKDRKKMAPSTSGKYAITNYRVIERFSQFDLVEFSLETGRTHQIRVHAKMLGHPIVGDDVYGKKEKSLAGQLLHSYKMSFIHPRTKEVMNFEIDLPEYFKEYIVKYCKK